jgi:hypothetical protein
MKSSFVFRQKAQFLKRVLPNVLIKAQLGADLPVVVHGFAQTDNRICSVNHIPWAKAHYALILFNNLCDLQTTHEQKNAGANNAAAAQISARGPITLS